MNATPTVIQTLNGDTIARSPEPGELWVTESELLTFLHVVQQGRSSICLMIRKRTGQVMNINLEGFVTSDCKPLLEKPCL